MNKIETGIYTRISKRIAKKMYNDGQSVYVVPCKVYPSDNNYWITPYEIAYTAEMQQIDLEYPTLAYQHTFESRMANFEYYNCNYELGYYTAFYTKMEG